MPHCPGRLFPNDTLNTGVRPLRDFALLAMALMPGLLSAQARLPTGAIAVNPESGGTVYRERRSALYSDSRMTQSDVICLSPDGEVLGRTNLDLSGDYAELDWIGVNGEHLHLSHGDERWVSRYKTDERVQTQVSWPRIRSKDLIEDQMLVFLQTHVDDLKQQSLTKLVTLRAPDLQRRSYEISVKALDARRLDVRLRVRGWFADDGADMRIVMENDGRLLSYEGPSRCPLADDGEQRVDVRYLY